ncbi:MAG: hypothetical protein QOD76_981 [Solirubrobacteraceae bacterium]|jgi:hypothetical protein|nr:hypothetical protein [Solirubrobacteraceae bacterium]
MGRVGRKACRLAAASAAATVAALVAAGSAGAVDPPSPWDGVNPFVCKVYNVGTNSDFPPPPDDPFCVEFDKTHQNVTQLGVVDFLSKEPGRVAAVSNKCWYHQSDHWRGSVIQGDATTKTYEWDGSYFYNRATGDGGVYVENFNFNGQTSDPRTLPGFPHQYDNFYGPGKGGMITHNSVPVDPSCVAKAAALGAGGKHHGVYNPHRPLSGCLSLRGLVGSRRLGRVPVGTTAQQLRRLLGTPPRSSRGFSRYCLTGGGSFLVGLTDSNGRAALLLTNGRAFQLQGVLVGTLARNLRRGWTRATLRLRVGSTRVYALNRRSGVLCGVRGGKVRWLAVYDRSRVKTVAGLAGYVLRSSG